MTETGSVKCSALVGDISMMAIITVVRCPILLMLSRDHILQQLLTLKPHLQKHYQISDIGLFGSVARAQNSMNSDLDIVVKGSIIVSGS